MVVSSKHNDFSPKGLRGFGINIIFCLDQLISDFYKSFDSVIII